MASGYAPSPSMGPQFAGSIKPVQKPVAASIKPIGIEGLRAMKASAPNASGMSDAEFALSAHQHAYSDVPLADFLKAVGLDRGDVLYETRAPGSMYGDYARTALATPGAGETPDAAAQRQSGSLPVRRAGTGEGMARSYLQGGTLGFGDEIVAAGAAALDPLVHGNSGKDYWDRFRTYMGREQGLNENFRKDNPIAAYGSEIAGSIPTLLAIPSPSNLVGGLLTDAAAGGAYGFGSTDGSLTDRAKGALLGAGMGIGGAAAGNMVGHVAGEVASNAATKAATRKVIEASPSAATLKASSKAGFKAAEDSGAQISQRSLGTLQANVRQLAADEGLMLPSGRVTNGYPKAAGALRMIDEHAKGDMSMKQAQALLKTARGVANTGGSEGEFGRKLVREVIDHMDSMRPNDFVTAPASVPGQAFNGSAGPEAIQAWRQGMSDWAKFKRTDTIEKIARKATYAKGGYAEGLRSGFRKVLTSERRQQGFSADELQAIEQFVRGGPTDAFLRYIQNGGVFPAAIAGHVAGGLPGAIVAGGVKLGAGAAAGAVRDRGAQRVADQVRAMATGARMPNPAVLPRLPSSTAGRIGIGVALPTTADPRQDLLHILVQGGR